MERTTGGYATEAQPTFLLCLKKNTLAILKQNTLSPPISSSMITQGKHTRHIKQQPLLFLQHAVILRNRVIVLEGGAFRKRSDYFRSNGTRTARYVIRRWESEHLP